MSKHVTWMNGDQRIFLQEIMSTNISTLHADHSYDIIKEILKNGYYDEWDKEWINDNKKNWYRLCKEKETTS